MNFPVFPATDVSREYEDEQESDAIEWEYTIRPIGTAYIFAAMSVAWGAASLFLAGLGVAFAFWEGTYRGVPALAAAGGIIFVAFMILSYLILALLYRNKYPVAFHLDSKIIHMRTLSAPAMFANRLAIILGLFGGGSRGMTTSGAGLIGVSQESTTIDWDDVDDLETRPDKSFIKLLNTWRPIMYLHVPPQRFAEIEARVRRELASREAERPRPPARPATPAGLRALLTLFLVGICVTLMGQEKAILIPVAACFGFLAAGLFMLWGSGLVSRLAGLVLATLAVTLPLRSWRAEGLESQGEFTTLSTGLEIGYLAALALLGLAFALGCLRAKPVPART